MRINLYLSENNEKDRIIIDFLEKRYNSKDFIKETLYTLATGEGIKPKVNRNISSKPIEKVVNEEVAASEEVVEEFEEITDLDNIEL